MTEALEFETYLSISSKKFKIYLLDTKNLKNLYFEEKNFENSISILDLNNLEKFLDNNIFKIEKLIGKFVKNIYLFLKYIKEDCNRIHLNNYCFSDDK